MEQAFFVGCFCLLCFCHTYHKVIIFCSYYYLLFLQLEPLAEDILHQTPNKNAVISLQKIIEIQSMSSRFFILISNQVQIIKLILWTRAHEKTYVSFSNMRNIFRVIVICTYYVFIPKCVMALLLMWQSFLTLLT